MSSMCIHKMAESDTKLIVYVFFLFALFFGNARVVIQHGDVIFFNPLILGFLFNCGHN